MKKNNKQSLIQNTELRTFSIRIKPDKLEKKLYDYNSKHSAQIEYLKNKYKDNQLWNELKEIANCISSLHREHIPTKKL